MLQIIICLAGKRTNDVRTLPAVFLQRVYEQQMCVASMLLSLLSVQRIGVAVVAVVAGAEKSEPPIRLTSKPNGRRTDADKTQRMSEQCITDADASVII